MKKWKSFSHARLFVTPWTIQSSPRNSSIVQSDKKKELSLLMSWRRVRKLLTRYYFGKSLLTLLYKQTLHLCSTVFTRQGERPRIKMLGAKYLALPILTPTTLAKAKAGSIPSHPLSQVRLTFVRDMPSSFHFRCLLSLLNPCKFLSILKLSIYALHLLFWLNRGFVLKLEI